MRTTKAQPELPELTLADWEETKNTLHLWAQIVGKVRMSSTAPRNHWWHVALYVDVRGLTTRRMHSRDGVAFEIDFDFVDHRLVVATNRGEVESFELVDGLSVAEFDEKLHRTLAALGIDVAIREQPYRVQATTPFPDDREHASYDRDAVERFWRVLEWTDGVLEEFAGWYCGKTSPVHLFWHSFDLALTRFGGARAPAVPDASPVDEETYSHEVVSFGFWAGDAAHARAELLLVHGAGARGASAADVAPEGGTLDGVREWLAGGAAVRLGTDGPGPEGFAPCLPRERVPGRSGTFGVGSCGAHVVLVPEPTRAEPDPRWRRTRGQATNGGGVMEDAQVHTTIEQLVAEEHELWQREAAGTASDADRQRLEELKVALDQSWDLLRQRRALRDAGRDPDDADERRPEVVESYEQ